jgi:hypothetical protein
MPDNVTAPAHKFLSEGMSLDEVIAELKRIGFDHTLTALALQRVTGMSKEQAEDRVSNHPAWSTSGRPSGGG